MSAYTSGVGWRFWARLLMNKLNNIIRTMFLVEDVRELVKTMIFCHETAVEGHS